MIAELPVALMASHELTTERIADDAAFEALRQEWDELLLASDSSCIFLTWEWLYTWWKHLAEDRSLFILSVRRGTELVALAPLGLRPQSLLQGRPFPFLEFLGSGFVGSDYLDVVVRRGNAPEVCRALTDYLSRRGVPLKWTNVKKDGSVAALLLDGLKQKRWVAAETQTNVCPFIPLRDSTWTTYLAGLSTDHRYNFNRKWRRLERDYKVRFDQIETAEQCREATDLLIAQHNARWQDRGGSDAFHTAGLIAFHGEWTQLALSRGWLRLYQLRLDEKPAASLYGFLYRGIFYFYQSGFDDAYKQASVGLITMGLAIQSAIKEGAEEYDLLHGDESYKSHWCRHSRYLVRLESFPPGILGTVCRVSIELGRAARRLRRGVTVKEQAA